MLTGKLVDTKLCHCQKILSPEALSVHFHSLPSSQSTFDTTFVMTGLQPFIVYCTELRAENQFSVRNNPFENGFGFPVELQTLEGGGKNIDPGICYN